MPIGSHVTDDTGLGNTRSIAARVLRIHAHLVLVTIVWRFVVEGIVFGGSKY